MPQSQASDDQIRAWKDRLKVANRREIEELRSKSMDQKLVELESLFCAAVELGWKQPSRDVEIVRARWLKLRRAYER